METTLITSQNFTFQLDKRNQMGEKRRVALVIEVSWFYLLCICMKSIHMMGLINKWQSPYVDLTSSNSFAEGRNDFSLFHDISSRARKGDMCYIARFHCSNYL